MTAKVIPMKPTKHTSPPKVTPEAGWELHSPYGALKDLEGRLLERLEAIHALLMKRDGLTSMDAAARVFGPFVADANSEPGMKYGADKLRQMLRVCDLADKASSLFPATKYVDRSHLEQLAELVPYVPHHHFDRGSPEALLYSLGQMAGEVWAPHSGDFDLNDRPCASFAEGYFPSVVKARQILGPLSVRHELAHKLWGWGSVEKAGAGDLTVAQEVQATGIPARAIKVVQRELAPEWTGQKLAGRLSELKKQCREQGTRNYTQLLSTESGVPIREITRRIKAESGSAIAGMAGQLKRKTG